MPPPSALKRSAYSPCPGWLEGDVGGLFQYSYTLRSTATSRSVYLSPQKLRGPGPASANTSQKPLSIRYDSTLRTTSELLGFSQTKTKLRLSKPLSGYGVFHSALILATLFQGARDVLTRLMSCEGRTNRGVSIMM